MFHIRCSESYNHFDPQYSQTILDRWEKFTESKTEPEAQENVKNLLDVLTKKISY